MQCTAFLSDIFEDQPTYAMYQEYLSKWVSDVAEREILLLDESTYVADAARTMKEKGLSSVIVTKASNQSEAVGIVTEKDILYRVVAENRGPYKTTLGQIMSSPLIAVEEDALVKEAIILMRKNNIRRLPVTTKGGGSVIGLITLKSVIGGNSQRSIALAEIDLPPSKSRKFLCPYCQSAFDSKDDLSKHIDRLHLGSGLLEGDLRRW